jgi:myo-inositol-1(or 4)-monophosphatase
VRIEYCVAGCSVVRGRWGLADHEAALQFAVQVAREAGRLIRDGVRCPFGVRSKGPRDLLTDIDLAAERLIVEAIRARYADHDILTEETLPEERRSSYQWIIDPLDGTGNFSRRYPCFSTSIALVQDDEPIVGVVYEPMLDNLFAAALGAGARLGGELLSVSQVDSLTDSLIGMDWTREANTRAENARIIARLTPLCGSLRICGSAAAAICYVAAGWWDAYWHLGLCSWDAAAGALIVREAGGVVTDRSGRRWRPRAGSCLATNGRIHDLFRVQVCAKSASDLDSNS